MNMLSNLLASATAEIGHEYFRLPIDGGGPVYRERVYCYELYHQMRRRWPDDGPFRLNGEVDKAAHPVLSRLDASYAKPDLLVHGPGDMGRNHAIIEVKSQKATAEGIEKDIRTLSLFRRRVGYERAIYLIYGHGNLERIFNGSIAWQPRSRSSQPLKCGRTTCRVAPPCICSICIAHDPRLPGGRDWSASAASDRMCQRFELQLSLSEAMNVLISSVSRNHSRL
jgi:hypothetical protein